MKKKPNHIKNNGKEKGRIEEGLWRSEVENRPNAPTVNGLIFDVVCPWISEWTLHQWDMIKHSGMSSTLLIIQALYSNAERQHCIQLKRDYAPPWKSSVALCPVTLAQPFNSCQGFITQRQHTVSHSMHGSFMCCVVHMLTWAGQADVSA